MINAKVSQSPQETQFNQTTRKHLDRNDSGDITHIFEHSESSHSENESPGLRPRLAVCTRATAIRRKLGACPSLSQLCSALTRAAASPPARDSRRSPSSHVALSTGASLGRSSRAAGDNSPRRSFALSLRLLQRCDGDARAHTGRATEHRRIQTADSRR
jgi:hypothetical protein